jgi:hypothetical protein
LVGGPRETIADKERQLIIRAIQDGGTATEVASLYGRSARAVRQIAREEGLSFSRHVREAKHDLTLRLPEAAISLLSAAAKRRKQSTAEVATNVVIGVLMRGHFDYPPDLDGALKMAAKYEVEKNARSSEADLSAGMKPV